MDRDAAGLIAETRIERDGRRVIITCPDTEMAEAFEASFELYRRAVALAMEISGLS